MLADKALPGPLLRVL